MKEVKELMGLGKEYDVIKVEEEIKNKKTIKKVYVIKNTKKERCPICNRFTKSIHDKLKPITLKYVKAFEYETYVVITKRRFICHNCNKKFTENVNLNNENKSISNKLEQKVLKDLMNYNLSLKHIAKENNISDMTARQILKDAMNNYPEHLRLLPSVISFDEFKADTNKGKYAFIINDLLHKKVLDILSSRKKEDLLRRLLKKFTKIIVNYYSSLFFWYNSYIKKNGGNNVKND